MEILASVTFGQVLLTVLEVALLALWIWVAVMVIVDVFRSKDLSGAAKAGWLLLIVIVPLLGVLIYLIARGDKMEAHEERERAQDELTSLEQRRAGADPLMTPPGSAGA